jgi:hypothetical protein
VYLKKQTAENISDYISVNSDGTQTTISVDRDGKTGTTYQSADILVLKVDTTLEELLQNNQIIF